MRPVAKSREFVEAPILYGSAPKYRTKGCSRYWRPNFAVRKWLTCFKNQCSRSRAVSGWAWTSFCVILWGPHFVRTESKWGTWLAPRCLELGFRVRMRLRTPCSTLSGFRRSLRGSLLRGGAATIACTYLWRFLLLPSPPPTPLHLPLPRPPNRNTQANALATPGANYPVVGAWWLGSDCRPLGWGRASESGFRTLTLRSGCGSNFKVLMLGIGFGLLTKELNTPPPAKILQK